MTSLAGKVAIVTGGSRGIGRGIAEAFLREGASVVMNGRSAEKGAATLAELNVGDRAHFIAGEVQPGGDGNEQRARRTYRDARVDSAYIGQ